MVSLVRLRPTSLALLGRADRCEVLLDLWGMESPCRWFTVAALALAKGMRQLPGRVGCRVVFLVRLARDARCRDRKSVVMGKSVAVRVDYGVSRIIKNKNTNTYRHRLK